MAKIKIDHTQLITATDKAHTAQQQKEATRKEQARAYLAETDWLITRRAETRKSVPREVLEKRAEARKVLTLD